VTKTPDRIIKEEGFILAHIFRGFCPWLLSPMHFGRILWWQKCGAKAAHLTVDRKQKVGDRKGPETRYIKNLPTSNLFPPARL
jgi:hypothetical protein